MNYKILDGINAPSDIKKLNKDQIAALSSEIREFLIQNIAKTGGQKHYNRG